MQMILVTTRPGERVAKVVAVSIPGGRRITIDSVNRAPEITPDEALALADALRDAARDARGHVQVPAQGGGGV